MQREFTIGEEIKENSVYKGIYNGNDVIVKIFSIEEYEFYELEVENTKNISNYVKFTPKFIDNFSINGICYIITEYIDGVDLSFIENISFPLLVKITIKTLAILRELNDYGYVHHDIKPDNILLTKDEEVYLIDFGFSCFLENFKQKHAEREFFKKPKFKCVPTVRGTPQYIAPEVWASLTAKIPSYFNLNNGEQYQKIDIYSLAGVVCHLAGFFDPVREHYFYENPIMLNGIEIYYYNYGLSINFFQPNFGNVKFNELVKKMLLISPIQRPTSEECLYNLNTILAEEISDNYINKLNYKYIAELYGMESTTLKSVKLEMMRYGRIFSRIKNTKSDLDLTFQEKQFKKLGY